MSTIVDPRSSLYIAVLTLLSCVDWPGSDISPARTSVKQQKHNVQWSTYSFFKLSALYMAYIWAYVPSLLTLMPDGVLHN